jgi:hypothetical protein
LLLKKLNKDRKKQAKKTDILCNDLIGAQRGFIRKLKTISFSAGFYESIIGITDLNNLMYTAVKLIEAESPGAEVAFFLRQSESFETHVFEKSPPASLDKERIESWFTAESMECACKANRICTLDEIFEMDASGALSTGPHGNPTGLHGTAAVTIPLGLLGASLGFMLICRSPEDKLKSDEIQNISGIVSGLSQGIACCRPRSRAAN